LGGSAGIGFDRESLEIFAENVALLVKNGISPALVLGGGNFFRGARGHLPAMKRHRADHVGMLATVMNAICFSDHLTAIGVKNRVFSAIAMETVCSTYQIDKARETLESGEVCLFAGGTGHPYFSTDSAAALRAVEVGCDVLIKATKVDGVYDADPMKNPSAKKFEKISYSDVLAKGLGIMDLVAITICRENRMPLLVLSLSQSKILLRACLGENVGSQVIED